MQTNLRNGTIWWLCSRGSASTCTNTSVSVFLSGAQLFDMCPCLCSDNCHRDCWGRCGEVGLADETWKHAAAVLDEEQGQKRETEKETWENINERKFSRPSLVKNIQNSFHDSVVLVWPRPSNVGTETLPHFVCVCLSTHSLQHWRGDLHKCLMHTCSMLLNIIDRGGSQNKFISKMIAAEGPDDAHYSSHMKRDPACMPSRLSSTFLY